MPHRLPPISRSKHFRNTWRKERLRSHTRQSTFNLALIVTRLWTVALRSHHNLAGRCAESIDTHVCLTKLETSVFMTRPRKDQEGYCCRHYLSFRMLCITLICRGAKQRRHSETMLGDIVVKQRHIWLKHFHSKERTVLRRSELAGPAEPPGTVCFPRAPLISMLPCSKEFETRRWKSDTCNHNLEIGGLGGYHSVHCVSDISQAAAQSGKKPYFFLQTRIHLQIQH